VKVVSHGQDRYDRTIGEIYHDGTQINGSLVAGGLAWHYVSYAPDDITLAEAETQARRLKKGLWSGSHKIIAPWDWRKMSGISIGDLRLVYDSTIIEIARDGSFNHCPVND